MSNRSAKYVIVPVALAAVAMCGCQRQVTITVVEHRPAAVRLDGDVRTLAVGAFEAQGPQDARWADLAGRLLRQRLGDYSRLHGRYDILPREAAPVGQVADAIITGRVEVSARHSRDFRRRPGAAAGAKPRPVDRATYTVAMTFTAARPDGRTLLARQLAKSYDSFDDPPLQPAPPGDDGITAELIRQCVEEFVAGLFPREAVVRRPLRIGRSEDIVAGNELAVEGEYDRALASYQRALEADPDDEAALYNAGLMCEILARPDLARRYYSRAYQLTGRKEYLKALRRVRQKQGTPF